MNNITKKNISIIISILILSILAINAWGTIKNIDISMVLFKLRMVGTNKTVFLFLLAILSVLSMIPYDIIITKAFSYKFKIKKLISISWISNTFNNFLGFAGIAGASTRVFLYGRNGVKNSDSIKMSLLLMLSTATGLSVLSIIALILTVLKPSKIFLDSRFLYIGLIGVSLYLIFFIFYSKIPYLRNKFSYKNTLKHINIKLLLASLLEWSMAFILFYSIVRLLNNKLSIGQVLLIYTVASSGGILSLIPGGVGSFDVIVILGLSSFSLDPNDSAAIVLIYRILYFIIPWFIGLILLTFNYSNKIKKKRTNPNLLKDFSTIFSIEEFSTKILSFWVFISGLILIVSSAYPSIPNRLNIVLSILPTNIVLLSHRVSITVGVILIILSHGIYQRTKKAFYYTIIMLLVGVFFTFIKALDFEEALTLMIITFLLFHSRKVFYRESAPISISFVIINLILTAVFLYAYSLVGAKLHIFFQGHSTSKIAFFLNKETFINNATLAFIGAWGISFIFYISSKRTPVISDNSTSNKDFTKLNDFLKHHEGNTLTHFSYLGDKHFFWYDDKVLIQYGKISNYLIALGDPIGDNNLFSNAIESFRDFADKNGLETAFYQVSATNLSLYNDNGYRFIKLGEEAVIELNEFSLSGKKKQSIRTASNRLTKNGYYVTEEQQPYSAELIKNLKEISDEWLGGKKEKGFSMGFFNPEFINKSLLLTMRNNNNSIVAFLTIVPPYDKKKVAIDLMRFKKDAPSGTMDFLLSQAISWAKNNGFIYFGLEMAPLSNVGKSKFSRKEDKLINIIFSHSKKWYNFEGLRSYKEKFTPQWTPKYLAYPEKANLYTLLLKLVKIISKVY